MRRAVRPTRTKTRLDGSGIVAIHASWLPLGLVPPPTIVRPSAEMPVAPSDDQSVRPVTPPPIKRSRKLCIPPPLVQRKASQPEAEVLPPTITEPTTRFHPIDGANNSRG